jgi:hypothetical protein
VEPQTGQVHLLGLGGDIKARENTGDLIDERGGKAFRFVLFV